MKKENPAHSFTEGHQLSEEEKKPFLTVKVCDDFNAAAEKANNYIDDLEQQIKELTVELDYYSGSDIVAAVKLHTEKANTYIESLKNQLQAARQTNIINGNHLNGIIAELEKLIEKAFVSGRSKQSWESFKKENGL